MRTLPTGFTRFTATDYMAFAGCEKFPDGTDPIIADLDVLVDLPEGVDSRDGRDPFPELGQVDSVQLIIAYGHYSQRVHLELNLSNGITYSLELETLDLALNVANLLKTSAVRPLPVSVLKSIGFRLH